MAGAETRVAVLVWGGTIASVQDGRSTRPLEDLNDLRRQIEKKNLSLPQGVDVSFINKNQGDTSDRIPRHFAELPQAIHEAQEDSEAVLVFDGSNAYAEDASAETLASYQSMRVPRMLIAGNDPFGTEGGDAEFRFIQALNVLGAAVTGKIREIIGSVSVRGFIPRASTITLNSHYGEVFESRVYPEIGRYTTGNQIEFFDHARRFKENQQFGELVDMFDPRVAEEFVSAGYYPGRLLEEVKGGVHRVVILNTRELGVVPDPANGPEYSLIPVMETAAEHNIPVLLNQIRLEAFRPERSKGNGERAGGIVVPGMTHEATKVKAMWIAARLGYPNSDTINHFRSEFYTNYGGETPYRYQD